MKTEDITITGLLFTGVVILGTWLYQDHKSSKQYLELQSNYMQAQSLAVDLYEENKSLHSSLLKVNTYVDDLENIITDPELAKLIQIRRDLRGYSIKERAGGYAMAWTESSWRLDPDHGDNGFTKGPCGITEYHTEYLAGLGLTRYSYASCVEILNMYKDRYGSTYAAIKAYKGIKTRTDLIDKTINLRDKILSLLKGN